MLQALGFFMRFNCKSKRCFLVAIIFMGSFIKAYANTPGIIPRSEWVNIAHDTFSQSMCEDSSFFKVCTKEPSNCKAKILARAKSCTSIHAKGLSTNSEIPGIEQWLKVIFSCIHKGYSGPYRDIVRDDQGCVDAIELYP